MKQDTDKTQLPKHIVIGSVFGQTITGTLFKHKVLKIEGRYNGYRWLRVENVETGHKQLINEIDLHCL